MASTTGTDFVLTKEFLEEVNDDKKEVGYAGFVAGARVGLSDCRFLD